MIISKYNCPLDNFSIHGVKTISSYDYVLLVDKQGQTLIKRVSSDGTDIKFTKMTITNDTTFSDIATTIDNFWSATIANYTYVYLFQL